MKPGLKSASATEIKNRFGDFLGEVVHGNEPLLIERHGKPVAVIVKFEQWTGREKTREVRTPWIDACLKLREEIKKNHPKLKPFSAVQLLRQIREDEE